jgi:zinc/manganese transport system permease protein
VAIAVAECAQIVGVLLVFTLMVGPAAAARNVSRRLGAGVALSAGLALFEAWGGLTLAFYTDWPVSFWITALSGAVYFVSLVDWRALALARGGELGGHRG